MTRATDRACEAIERRSGWSSSRRGLDLTGCKGLCSAADYDRPLGHEEDKGYFLRLNEPVKQRTNDYPCHRLQNGFLKR